MPRDVSFSPESTLPANPQISVRACASTIEIMPGLVVRPRSRILHGHDWVYASEVLKVFGDPADGDVISLKDGRDRLLGCAIFNSKSQIVARRFSKRRQELDCDFFSRGWSKRSPGGCRPVAIQSYAV